MCTCALTDVFMCHAFLIWLCLLLSCSVRTPISMKFFPRFFLLYFLVFHIYFFSYSYGRTRYHCWDLFPFLVESLMFLLKYWLDNFCRFFIFGSLYSCSLYAAPHSLLLEPFWGKHYCICLQVSFFFGWHVCLGFFIILYDKASSIRLKPVV